MPVDIDRSPSQSHSNRKGSIQAGGFCLVSSRGVDLCHLLPCRSDHLWSGLPSIRMDRIRERTNCQRQPSHQSEPAITVTWLDCLACQPYAVGLSDNPTDHQSIRMVIDPIQTVELFAWASCRWTSIAVRVYRIAIEPDQSKPVASVSSRRVALTSVTSCPVVPTNSGLACHRFE